MAALSRSHHHGLCIAICSVIACWGSSINAADQALVNDESLHAVHNALFASFLPVDELPDDPHTAALLRSARDAIWQQAGHAPRMQQLLEPFVDLRRFGNACDISQAIGPTVQPAGAVSFAAIR